MTPDGTAAAPLSATALRRADLGTLFELARSLHSIVAGVSDGEQARSPAAARVGELVRAILVGCEEHRHIAEREGLLAELESRIGRPHEMERVRHDHDHLVGSARELSACFEALSPNREYVLLGRLVTQLEAALTSHESHEGDLIQEAFRDTGAGD